MGLDLVGEEDGDNGAMGQDRGGVLSGGRDALKEACAVVVEDAINAVLLGLRERVSLTVDGSIRRWTLSTGRIPLAVSIGLFLLRMEYEVFRHTWFGER